MSGGHVPGLGGTLLSPRAAGEWLRMQPADASTGPMLAISLWAAAAVTSAGPATSERRMLETIEGLFSSCLGFRCRFAGDHVVAVSPSTDTVTLFAFAWQRPMTLAARDLLRAAMDAGAGWAIGFNGAALGIADARPASPRRMATIAVDALAAYAETAALAAALLEAQAFSRGSLDGAVRFSDESSLELKRGLRDGVNESVAALTRELSFDDSIAVLFRMLFVLFAEARALVPVWHRVYHQHYSLASVADRPLPRDARGVWASLEAGRRLLGAGCRAGTLQVNGFNGRLFAPLPLGKWASSRLLDSRLDRPASDALASLVEYRPARGGARRVNYAELDVEELGSIYERVLDLDPAGDGRARKESGSFYTPRSLTEFIVRRTLAPLTSHASSERILSLRVVDPAMGSGAFLVAALHFLAGALERAMVREGQLLEGDVTAEDRQQLRRTIAQRCLYGVDANPTAAMLAKLSLWLATLSGGKPLGFLDHRLKCGNSLAGIDPLDARRPPGLGHRHTAMPLFEEDAVAASLRTSAERARHLAGMAEETLEDVRKKQRFHETAAGVSTESWRKLCDAWCGWWFVPRDQRPDAREYAALADALTRGSRLLPRRGVERRLREIAAIGAAQHFFHWPLEFPDVFMAGGFDAVVGNPPWEMLRAGSGSRSRETFKGFVRGSGLFPLAIGGHLNLYQLFLERVLSLARNGGRIGMVLPWGLMTDDGSAALRGRLLDGTRIDTLARFDNGEALFQAHRSLRFAALTTTIGAATSAFELTRVSSARALDDLPDTGVPHRGPILTGTALRILGGSSRRIPDVADARALAIAARLAETHRALGDARGWHAAFGRELNLSDDRAAFGATGMPVLEGKHVHPGRIDATAVRHRISRAAAARLLPARPFERPRLAYRDVTAATNKQTVIAAIVPAGMATSHSLFCLRNTWDLQTQRALCVILNSRVANFLVRLFVGSHLTTSLIEWLPVPDREQSLAALRCCSGGHEQIVADLYGLTEDERAAI